MIVVDRGSSFLRSYSSRRISVPDIFSVDERPLVAQTCGEAGRENTHPSINAPGLCLSHGALISFRGCSFVFRERIKAACSLRKEVLPTLLVTLFFYVTL